MKFEDVLRIIQRFLKSSSQILAELFKKLWGSGKYTIASNFLPFCTATAYPLYKFIKLAALCDSMLTTGRHNLQQAVQRE
mgnify:CR=1 FL=1